MKLIVVSSRMQLLGTKASLKRFGVCWLRETLLCRMRQRQSQACALKLVSVYATANEAQTSVSRSFSISTNHLLAKVRGLVAFF